MLAFGTGKPTEDQVEGCSLFILTGNPTAPPFTDKEIEMIKVEAIFPKIWTRKQNPMCFSFNVCIVPHCLSISVTKDKQVGPPTTVPPSSLVSFPFQVGLQAMSVQSSQFFFDIFKIITDLHVVARTNTERSSTYFFNSLHSGHCTWCWGRRDKMVFTLEDFRGSWGT